MGADALPWPQSSNSVELRQRAAKAKVLCVGAGGIGCELLKTLALSGFQDIQVIDLDTIETSNLNRQFLFRARHVGSSKAAVAAEAVRCFAPGASIIPHQGNVKDTAYGVSFFAGFDLVLNGLDNMEARRHVNRLTLAAGTPLVESGTEGFLGQVTPHIKGLTECYECRPKPMPKSYPVCTIRNTPDKPIHCIVWAKELLFPRLFGRPEDITDLDEEDDKAAPPPAVAMSVDAKQLPLPNLDSVAAKQQAALAGQTAPRFAETAASAAKQEAADKSFFLRRESECSSLYARRIFTRVFTHDIERVLRMEDLWKSRQPPQPLQLDALLPVPTSGCYHRVEGADQMPRASASTVLGFSDPHARLSVKDLAALFIVAITRYLDHRPSEVGSAVFDKEDDLAVDFVTAAANLRSACYNIEGQSLFDAKGMAGSIVHAVATTNALISGLITLEALKLLAGATHACKNTMVLQHVSCSRLVYPTTTDPPNKCCMVCGTSQLHMSINTASTPLSGFIDQVLKKRLALVSPTVSCDNFIYEEGPDLEADEAAESAAHRPTMLADLPGGGIRDGSIVHISDQAQAFDVQVIVTHQDEWDEEKNPEGFTLKGTVPTATRDPEGGGKEGDVEGDGNDTDSDSGFEILAPVSVSELESVLLPAQGRAEPREPSSKRNREADDGASPEQPQKRRPDAASR